MAKAKAKARVKVKSARIPVSVSVLESGRASEFWRLICQAIDANIEELEKDRRAPELITISAPEYKLRVELINGKIDHLENLKNTPDNLIASVLEDKPEEDLDPYEKVTK